MSARSCSGWWVLAVHRAPVAAPGLRLLPSLCRRRLRAVVVSPAVFTRPSLSTGCAQLAAEGTFSGSGVGIAAHCCVSLLPSGCRVPRRPKESDHKPGSQTHLGRQQRQDSFASVGQMSLTSGSLEARVTPSASPPAGVC